jgi:RNA polymerase sigma-70 factor (ECF subfamily)
MAADRDPPDVADQLDLIYRREVGRCTATLVRVLGGVDLAEEFVAEAFAVAARRWPVDGIPPNPGGWITTTARNRAIDHLRRESTRADRHLAAHRLAETGPDDSPDLGPLEVVPDDQLRLIFLCCHPGLGSGAQVALTLRLLGGLTTPEIARAFLVPEPTMAQRLVRAKRRIRHDQLAYHIPPAPELPARLPPVLATLYLIFNEGHTASSGAALSRVELSTEAVRLARLLVELLPNEHEPKGLLALMLLTEARRPARTGPDGAIVRLADQDRSLWDAALIAEGHEIVRACLRHDDPGRYQIQAAVAAVHADAPTAEATDWAQVVALYDLHLQLEANPVVALNRAIAITERDGPTAGLSELDLIDGLDHYHLYHATRGELLARLGRPGEAVTSLDRAIELTGNDVERRHLHAQRATITSERGSRP